MRGLRSNRLETGEGIQVQWLLVRGEILGEGDWGLIVLMQHGSLGFKIIYISSVFIICFDINCTDFYFKI